jgi:hypothetical protein
MAIVSLRLEVNSSGAVLASLEAALSLPNPPLGAKPKASAVAPHSLLVSWVAPPGPSVTTGLYLKTRRDGDWFWYRVLLSGIPYAQTSRLKDASTFKGCEKSQWKHPSSGSCAVDLGSLPEADYFLVASHFNEASQQYAGRDPRTQYEQRRHQLPPSHLCALALRPSLRMAPGSPAGHPSTITT